MFAIFKSSLNLNPIRHWSENWCPGYLEHALCSSEIHLAAAKSLEIIDHVTNCCKRPIASLNSLGNVFRCLAPENLNEVSPHLVLTGGGRSDKVEFLRDQECLCDRFTT